jgi:hypothetical protein
MRYMFCLGLHRSCLLAFLPLLPLSAAGSETREEGPPLDKTRYTAWNPTPDSLLREMSADRPDKTETAYTVDAGHIQVEMDLANLTIDRNNPDGGKSGSLEVAPINFKLGLLNNVDVQLVLPAWREERVFDPPPGEHEWTRGFTDLIPRVKWNLWGNDGGITALAMMPFVKIPTATGGIGNREWEGGLKIPFAVDVLGWDVSAMTEFDATADDDGSGHHAEFINSISVSHPVAGGLAAAAEFFSMVSTERDADWEGSFDMWLTYEINKNLRLDGGVYIGVTPAADDWHPFIGLTFRH